MTKIDVLIVDDSAIARGIFEKAFSNTQDFNVVTSVSNGRKAVDYCRENHVDLVVSDCQMPEMDGIEAAKIITEQGIPVCLYSDDESYMAQAVQAGAILFKRKPSLAAYSVKNFELFIHEIRKAVEKNNITHQTAQKIQDDSPYMRRGACKILCIGASTGGPSAVEEVLKGLGRNFPLPILYVQHIDENSDKKMVDWFNNVCPNTPMHLARDGELAKPGHVYMAPAEKHLVISYVKDNYLPVLHLSDEAPERFLRPAVNKLFRSAANNYKSACLAVLLTGMGRDGAEGCKEVVDKDGITIVEDKSTCAVFGMPAAAIELDSAKYVLPRNKIAEKILSIIGD